LTQSFTPQPTATSQAPTSVAPISHNLSNLRLTRPQAKLTVGQPGDAYEQEADRVAEQVMRIAAPEPAVETEAQPETVVQRNCSTCGAEDELISRKEDRKANNIEPSSGLESRLTSSKGGGSSLPDEVRAFMEPRFGADFSQVRVHTDSEAVQMNRELGAQAFAHGSDIYYGAGKSPSISELTAHELTHVVQQTDKVQPLHNKESKAQPIDSIKGLAELSQSLQRVASPDTGTVESGTTPLTKIKGSVASVSWIDPASPAGSGPLGVSDPAPPATITESFVTGASGFRFSNYLNAWLHTSDSVHVSDQLQTFHLSGRTLTCESWPMDRSNVSLSSVAYFLATISTAT